MEFPKKKLEIYTLSPSNFSPTSYFPIKASPSTQRILHEVQQMKNLTKSEHSMSKNQNSLKYLKLAPINPFSDSNSSYSHSMSKSRRNYKLQGILPINITKNCVSRCAFISQKGSDNKTLHDLNQDSVLLQTKLNSQAYQFLFGVFDGHGQNGHSISTLLKNRISSNVPYCPKEPQENDLVEYLENSVNLASRTVMASPIDSDISGSTLCLVIISGPHIICANVGDSRCIIGKYNDNWDYEILSKEHKPNNPQEAERIEDAGGFVSVFPNKRNQKEGMLRVWTDDPEIPGLAMTRSIGDKAMKHVGVIDTCEIVKHKVCSEDKFLILASDGIWDVISNMEAVEIVSRFWKEGKSELACKGLVETATEKWKESGDHIDDISVIVVFLHAKE